MFVNTFLAFTVSHSLLSLRKIPNSAKKTLPSGKGQGEGWCKLQFTLTSFLSYQGRGS